MRSEPCIVRPVEHPEWDAELLWVKNRGGWAGCIEGEHPEGDANTMEHLEWRCDPRGGGRVNHIEGEHLKIDANSFLDEYIEGE